MPGIIVKPRSRILHGHDWVYGSEILKTFGQPENGSVVSIKDGRDRFLGSGMFNADSHLTVRRFSRQRQELDRDFFERRIGRAWELRQRLDLSPRPLRVFWSESDGIPGLIIDRYGDTAVVQTLTLAVDQKLSVVAEVVREVLGVANVVERNDSSGRVAEGLPVRKGVLAGEPEPRHAFFWQGVHFTADLLHGQKTGFYLDQLDSYAAVAAHAAGRQILDCFSNQGGFALTCAKAGATSVTAVESGAEAAAQLRRHATENDCAIVVEEKDAFAFLRQAEKRGATWDGIVLDPPSFAKGRGAQQAALRGYRELHLRAGRLLAPTGWLATFSCSHHISESDFLQVATEGLLDAGRTARLAGTFSQPLDHPVLPHLPETRYLKGFLLEMLPGR
jgi:23S rRNA (cytosine1962-C5)-methyltransferase